MDHQQQLVKDRLEWVNRELERQHDTAVAMSVTDYLRPNLDTVFELVDGEGAQLHMLEYISQEARRHVADASDLPSEFDKRRDKPMCTCSVGVCPPRNGRLPVEVREAPSTMVGVRRFKHQHTGEPIVLLEARRDYLDALTDLYDRLGVAKVALANEQTVDEVLEERDRDRDREESASDAPAEAGSAAVGDD